MIRRLLLHIFAERCRYCGTPRHAAALDCITPTMVAIGSADRDPHLWPAPAVTFDRRG